jgi:hypothetical protein
MSKGTLLNSPNDRYGFERLLQKTAAGDIKIKT